MSAEGPSQTPTTSPPPPLVLIVDDSVTNLHVLHSVLKAHFRVKAARSGEKALTIAVRDLPDAVLLDVMMPGMDGPTVCRRLKQNPATAHIPVIFISGSVDADTETLCQGAGAADLLRKPVQPAPLIRRLRALIADA